MKNIIEYYICSMCGRRIDKKYYAFGLDNKKKKFILGYYCYADALTLKDWLNLNTGK